MNLKDQIPGDASSSFLDAAAEVEQVEEAEAVIEAEEDEEEGDTAMLEIEGEEAEEAGGRGDDDDPAGVVHVTLKASQSPAMLEEIPGELYIIIQKAKLVEVYKRMINAIYTSGRGRLNSLKSSTIAKILYLEGYEQAFEAMHVDLYLVRRKEGFGSVMKLYFVDRSVQKDWVPKHVYRDGGHLKLEAGLGSTQFNINTEGYAVLEISPEDRKIDYEKTELPVEVTRLLETKKALGLLKELAARARALGPKVRNIQLAKLVSEFKEQFEAQYVSVAFCQALQPNKGPHAWFTWIGFADKDKIENPVFKFEYKEHRWQAWDRCMQGDSTDLVQQIFKTTNFKVGVSSGKVACNVYGAVHRVRDNDCKCSGEDEIVYCGNTQVSTGRKFIAGILSLRTTMCTMPWKCINSVPKAFESEESFPLKATPEENLFEGNLINVTYDGVTKEVKIPADTLKGSTVIVKVPEWSCDYYKGHPTECGLHNTDTFFAEKQCCACTGGGEVIGDAQIAYCARFACEEPGMDYEP